MFLCSEWRESGRPRGKGHIRFLLLYLASGGVPWRHARTGPILRGRRGPCGRRCVGAWRSPSAPAAGPAETRRNSRMTPFTRLMDGASGITPRVPSGACWSHKMTHKLRVDVLSDQDYEELIAECYVDDDCVIIVSEERGPDQLEIEILVRPDGQPRRSMTSWLNYSKRRRRAYGSFGGFLEAVQSRCCRPARWGLAFVRPGGVVRVAFSARVCRSCGSMGTRAWQSAALWHQEFCMSARYDRGPRRTGEREGCALPPALEAV
jgi:hypothetical protein